MLPTAKLAHHLPIAFPSLTGHQGTACTLRFEKRDGREPSPSNLSVRSDWHLPHLIIIKLNPSQVQIVTYRLPHVGPAEAEQLVLEHLLEGARLGLALALPEQARYEQRRCRSRSWPNIRSVCGVLSMSMSLPPSA